MEVDVAAYAAEGWVVVRSLVGAEEVAALQQATDELEAVAASFVRDTAVGRGLLRGAERERAQARAGRLSRCSAQDHVAFEGEAGVSRVAAERAGSSRSPRRSAWLRPAVSSIR
jgi:hypothetical protein